MAEAPLDSIYHPGAKTLNLKSGSCGILDSKKNSKDIGTDGKTDDYDDDEASFDSVLCVPGSRMIKSGFANVNCADNYVIFVNAGGQSVKEHDIHIQPDSFFEGGDVLQTDEIIIDGGDIPCIYQSARFGNFSYRLSSLSPADYFVDLHFAEIVNTSGPKGMRVFNVFMQEEKVLSELDLYSVVGANKPLQVADVRISVREDGDLLIRFEGVCGSPIVSGICIKQASELPAPEEKQDYLICQNCAAEINISSCQDKYMRMKSTAKYEKQIAELKTQCQLKADECYEAWMSLTSVSQQLEHIKIELDDCFFQKMLSDQAKDKQAAKLKEVSNQYESDKKLWATSIDGLERKIKTLKAEQSQLSNEAHKCANSIPELNNMVVAVKALVRQYDDLKLKFSKEQAKRKKLYNQVQEAKGNIRVFCRCRPLRKDEISAGFATIVDFSVAKDGDLVISSSGSTKKNFKFDRVYAPTDNQVDVFADASPLVISVLDGYNVCILAYGQTGTGKTFTMEGTEQERGVNYRTLEQLFKTAKERRETFAYNISVSLLEVYNEQIRDLLATSQTSKRLEIRQPSEEFHHIPGIVEAKVECIREVWEVLQAGSSSRAVGSNNINEHSSRSHCMLCVLVRAKNLVNGECTKSKLWLVDLAGSERLAKTEAQGERLKEAQNINRSLSALGDVISALATKSSHIPYRNSKLTHILQDSLGGDSKTLMFVQISPSEEDLGETLSSLNFATRVRGVELGPVKRQIDMGELQKLKTTLDKTKQELRSKDDAFRKLEENFHNLESKTKGRDQFYKNQQEKVCELESQLASKTELCRQLQKQLLQLSEGMKGKEEVLLNFQQKVEELEHKLKTREQSVSLSLQKKVKEFENRLKERTQDFELQSGMLKEKVKELENKVATGRNNPGYQLLQHKIKELEGKLRLQEQECTPSQYLTEKLQATPNETKMSRTESMYDNGPLSMRSSQSSNRAGNSGSDLLKRTDSLRELRRRQIQSKGTENNFLVSASLLERKISTAEPNKARQIDSSKALARITRSIKPLSSAQRVVSNGKTNRDHSPGLMDNTHKLKMWLR